MPTLVVQRRDERFVPRDVARYVVERIPDSRYEELPGEDWIPWYGDAQALADAVERLLAGVWRERPWESAEPDRVLTTVLFTDLVDSTARAAEMGDRAWRELVGRHHAIVRRQIARFRGREVDTAGDGFFATFDGPARGIRCTARGIRCAAALVGAVNDLGIAVRAGLHTGECETIDGKVGGIAVHIGARVAAEAGPGEVLVSSTVKDLVAGSGLRFGDRGSHALKGIPGEWRLHAVER